MKRSSLGDLLIAVCLLGILMAVGTWVVRGWTGYFESLLRVGVITLLALMVLLELKDRPRYDPVRRFAARVWGSFWNKFC